MYVLPTFPVGSIAEYRLWPSTGVGGESLLRDCKQPVDQAIGAGYVRSCKAMESKERCKLRTDATSSCCGYSMKKTWGRKPLGSPMDSSGAFVLVEEMNEI